jgi:S1-C subfamily serine protease
MEEPLALATEPDDEGARSALPLGSFTGIVPGDARGSLEEMLSEPEGVLVASVVENSPADVAGVAEGDLLLSAAVGGQTRELKWPSEWRAIELETVPGSAIEIVLDRAGAERRARIVTLPRIHAPGREKVPKLREEQRVGVVLRGATEVEARAAGLGPGGGVVVVGLARSSPWRKDGVVYADLIRSVDGIPVAHPEVVLEAIRSAPVDSELALEIVRGGETRTIDVHLTRRASEVKHVTIPLIYSYENDRGQKETSFLLGLVSYESSAAAWQLKLLWLFSFSGGDADRLKVVGS